MAEPRDVADDIDFYALALKSINAGAPGLGIGIREHMARSIAMKCRDAVRTAALRSPDLGRDGEQMRAEGAEINPAWPVFCHMRLALSNERGVRLSLRDLERLHASPVGRLMDAAADYGTSTPGAAPDPVLLTGAVVVPANGSALPLAHEEKAGC